MLLTAEQQPMGATVVKIRNWSINRTILLELQPKVACEYDWVGLESLQNIKIKCVKCHLLILATQ